MLSRPNAAYLSVLVLLSVVLWLPRLKGPVDLRYDAGVYYLLGTSLAEGKGYRLLSEPGEIQAIQYPPLLPLFAAGTQLLTGSTDPAVAGHWLRLSFFVLFVAFVAGVYVLSRRFLAPGFAFLVALVTLFHVHTTWLSELFFAELPFALTSILFLLVAGREEGRAREWLAGMLGGAAFLLRSVGITLLAAWVGESLLRRRFRETAFRATLALVPVLVWQGYIAHVKGDAEYAQPAYEYQRAGYQYYNVGYVENVAYIDPFIPELGKVSPQLLVKRVARNLVSMTASLGEAVSSRSEWVKLKLETWNEGFAPLQVPRWIIDVPFVMIGVGVLCGLALLVLGGEWLIPLYVGGSVALICLSPWPGQFGRYLAPLTPLLALALFVALLAARERLSIAAQPRWRFASIAVIPVVVFGVFVMELVPLYKVYQKRSTAFYEDERGQQHEYRLFFYRHPWRLHDEALEWLKHVAKPGEIVATSTPHWAYLKTGLKAVLPPFEPDVREAQRLIDSVPVTYVIVDNMAFVDVTRRYTAPVVRAFSERWTLIHTTGDEGSQIYRRVTPVPSIVATERHGVGRAQQRGAPRAEPVRPKRTQVISHSKEMSPE